MNNNVNYIHSNPNQMINVNNNNSDNDELNTILTRDYNQITDAEYRELLNKKEQYLESNMRLEKNIIDIKKTKNKKISNVLKVIKENGTNLDNIKKQNALIEKEINNLCNVFKLTMEQAKLQNEIKQKNKKKFKLKTESVKNEENKLHTSVEQLPKNNDYDDIPIPQKRKIQSIDVNSSSKKKKKNKTREEKLKMIREKYKNSIEEINEDNQIKEKENSDIIENQG